MTRSPAQYPRTHRLQTGFTLVEVLVYLGILVLVSAGAVTLLISLQDTLVQYQAQQRLITSGRTAMERMLTEVRQADSVNTGASELATSTVGALALQAGATTTVFTRMNDATVSTTVNGVDQGPLVDEAVDVAGLTFFHYLQGDTELVRIRLQLRTTSELYTDTYTLQGAAIIRPSYAE